MPKMKTHSGAKKRVKITGRGRHAHEQTNNRHIFERKSSRRNRRLLAGTSARATPRRRGCSASADSAAERLRRSMTMARVKRAVNAQKKRRERPRAGQRVPGQRSRLYRKAKEQVTHSGVYAYDHRRDRKGDFRRLWIQRINAAARANGMTYNRFIQGLKPRRRRGRPPHARRVGGQRREAFATLVETAKAACPPPPEAHAQRGGRRRSGPTGLGPFGVWTSARSASSAALPGRGAAGGPRGAGPARLCRVAVRGGRLRCRPRQWGGVVGARRGARGDERDPLAAGVWPCAGSSCPASCSPRPWPWCCTRSGTRQRGDRPAGGRCGGCGCGRLQRRLGGPVQRQVRPGHGRLAVPRPVHGLRPRGRAERRRSGSCHVRLRPAQSG